MLVSYILMNYKRCNKMYFCRGRHSTTPQSTIQDQAHFFVSPTHGVFRVEVQRTEFSRLDRRKAPFLCTIQVVRAFLTLREEFLLLKRCCIDHMDEGEHIRTALRIQTTHLRGRDIKMCTLNIPLQIPELLFLIVHC